MSKKLIILSVMFAFVLIGASCFNKSNPDNNITWKGFYYKDSVYPSGSIEEKKMLDDAPNFFTLEACIEWGKNLTKNNPNDFFECAYGCRFDEDLQILICEDKTK